MSEGNSRISKWEKSPRWVRAQVTREFVADSKEAVLVWEHAHLPVYYFPTKDVRLDLLVPTGRSQAGRKSWHIRTGAAEIPNAAYAFTGLERDEAELNDMVAFRWSKIDHWYEEDEEIFVHARDPYHRVDTIPSSRQVRVEIDGVVLAESTRPYLLFETGLPTRYYLPPADVNLQLLTPTDSRTSCPYKGDASYWSAQVKGQLYEDIVWSYPEPIEESPKIKGLLSFYNEKVDILVDGELQERPKSPWS